jgi:hypothetical protein
MPPPSKADGLDEDQGDEGVAVVLVIAVMVLHQRIDGGQARREVAEVPLGLRDARGVVEAIEQEPAYRTRKHAGGDRRERDEEEAADGRGRVGRRREPGIEARHEGPDTPEGDEAGQDKGDKDRERFRGEDWHRRRDGSARAGTVRAGRRRAQARVRSITAAKVGAGRVRLALYDLPWATGLVSSRFAGVVRFAFFGFLGVAFALCRLPFVMVASGRGGQ